MLNWIDVQEHKVRYNLLLVIGICIVLIFSLQSIRVTAASPSFEHALHHPNPIRVSPAPFAQDTCVTDFPLGIYVNSLPLVLRGEEDVLPMLPAAEPGLAKQAGLLVPLGDQLGDVGQYYSQVAPSMESTINFRNITPVTQTFALTLYGDTGVVASALRSCAVAPRTTLSLQMGAGDIYPVDGDQALPMATVCDISGQTVEITDQQLTTNLHGIYHAEIATGAPNALLITLDTVSDKNQPSIIYHAASHAQPVPKRLAMSRVNIPAVLATRNKANWWDTELVVQNVTDHVTEVQFQLCDDGGRCFDNNLATLNAHERRIFLATHLLYSNGAGLLYARAGWFSATLTARAVEATNDSPQVVVTSNIFRQPVASDASEPQAEHGSTCFLQPEPVMLAQQTNYSTSVSNAFVLRIYNPGNTPNAVNISLVDGQGHTQRSTMKMLAAHGASAWYAQELFADFTPSSSDDTVSIEVQATQAIVAFAWQDGHALDAQATDEMDTTWYAPLVAAPTTEYRWDDNSEEDSTRVGYPGSKYGLADTKGFNHVQRPLWARMLNWYTWSANPRLCNETVTGTTLYSTYIPMWWGLKGWGFGDCRPDRCRRFLNSPSRLQKIRNDIPSNCTGRPLLLANEPDLESQAYMTYHELGRMIYQFRNWPGELYSPVMASYSYDMPAYVPETTAWCQEAVAHGLCPGSAECATCAQDGIVDGALDPQDINFKGLEDYFGANGRWVQGESWQFEHIIEGMALHFYSLIEPFNSDSYWRGRYLRQYRDRADQAGWSIIVSEYSFICWPDLAGKCPDINVCEISDHVDDLRQVLQENLGNYEAAHGFNPKKLFWFQTGCNVAGSSCAVNICLFQEPTRLTSPVGVCWYRDAANGGIADNVCDEPCSQSFLPFIEHKGK